MFSIIKLRVLIEYYQGSAAGLKKIQIKPFLIHLKESILIRMKLTFCGQTGTCPFYLKSTLVVRTVVNHNFMNNPVKKSEIFSQSSLPEEKRKFRCINLYFSVQRKTNLTIYNTAFCRNQLKIATRFSGRFVTKNARSVPFYRSVPFQHSFFVADLHFTIQTLI